MIQRKKKLSKLHITIDTAFKRVDEDHLKSLLSFARTILRGDFKLLLNYSHDYFVKPNVNFIEEIKDAK